MVGRGPGYLGCELVLVPILNPVIEKTRCWNPSVDPFENAGLPFKAWDLLALDNFQL